MLSLAAAAQPLDRTDPPTALRSNARSQRQPGPPPLPRSRRPDRAGTRSAGIPPSLARAAPALGLAEYPAQQRARPRFPLRPPASSASSLVQNFSPRRQPGSSTPAQDRQTPATLDAGQPPPLSGRSLPLTRPHTQYPGPPPDLPRSMPLSDR